MCTDDQSLDLHKFLDEFHDHSEAVEAEVITPSIMVGIGWSRLDFVDPASI
jgi:hypothetical protein